MTGISVPDIDGEGASQRHFSFPPGRLSFKPEGSDEWQDLEGCEGFTISIEAEPGESEHGSCIGFGAVTIPLRLTRADFAWWAELLRESLRILHLRLRMKRKGRPGWKRAHWKQLLK